jgi:hypothetical protein
MQPLKGRFNFAFSVSIFTVLTISELHSVEEIMIHGCLEGGKIMSDLRFSRRWLWRTASSGMLPRVDLVRTHISEELSASIIRVTRTGELGTTLAVTSNWRMLRTDTTIVFLHSVLRLPVAANVVPCSPILVTLLMEALSSSETSVLTRGTWRNIPEDAILRVKIRSVNSNWNILKIKSSSVPQKSHVTAPGRPSSAYDGAVN